MKIIQLKAENIKNLKAVEIMPNGKAVVLTGKNGAGKSAVLDSILAALTGKTMGEIIRKGEERAEITVDMGDFIVTRVFTQKGVRLEVASKDGDIKKSPQTFLDGLLGKISFDPLAFAGMKPRDQLDLLKDVVGLSFDDIEAQQREIYEQRTEVNTTIKGLIAQLKDATVPDPETPEEEVSFKDQIEVVNQLREKRDAYNRILRSKIAKEDLLAKIRKEGEETKARIKELEERLLALARQESDAVRAVNEIQLPPEVYESAIQAEQDKLSELENMNVKIRQAKRYNVLVRNSNRLREQSDKLTQQIDRLEQDKSTRIANAAFPIPCLSISDDSVLFGEIPFSQLSTGQQICVSTAIAMALNPDARIILVREGSLLDADGLKELIDMSAEKEYQVWIEKVDDTGKVGIYIEDGMIKAVDGKEIINDPASDGVEEQDAEKSVA